MFLFFVCFVLLCFALLCFALFCLFVCLFVVSFVGFVCLFVLFCFVLFSPSAKGSYFNDNNATFNNSIFPPSWLMDNLFVLNMGDVLFLTACMRTYAYYALFSLLLYKLYNLRGAISITPCFFDGIISLMMYFVLFCFVLFCFFFFVLFSFLFVCLFLFYFAVV